MKFYPVYLVHFARAGIVVHGGDVGFGEASFELLDDALARDVVGQASERLHAENVPNGGRGAVPSFQPSAASPRRSADRGKPRPFTCSRRLAERKRGRESPASREHEPERQPQRQQSSQQQIADRGASHAAVVVLPTIHFIIQSVQNKIGEVGMTASPPSASTTLTALLLASG